MHPLTLVAVGMYGRELPNQNGAPIRLVVPWKYGFKSVKSIVKIEFVQGQPQSFWAAVDPEVSGGQYFGPDGPDERKGYPVVVQSSMASHDEADARRLWEASEELTGVQYLYTSLLE